MINLNLYCSSPLATPNSKINCSESDVCLLLPCLLCCEVRSHSVVSNSFQPHELQHTRLLCPWGFSRQEYWRGLPIPTPGNLPTQGSNLHFLCLLHCRWILHPLSHQGRSSLLSSDPCIKLHFKDLEWLLFFWPRPWRMYHPDQTPWSLWLLPLWIIPWKPW